MDGTAANQDEVNHLIEQLQETYTNVPVETNKQVVPADELDDILADHQGDYIGSAYAWVVRTPKAAASVSESFRLDPGDSNRVLFLLPRASDLWGLPGGGKEGDESFEEAVIREVREETGIRCEVTRLWLLRRLEWVSHDERDDRSTYSVQVFFDAEYTGGHIGIQPGEANGAAWFAKLPSTQRMLPANRTRAESWTPDTESSCGE